MTYGSNPYLDKIGLILADRAEETLKALQVATASNDASRDAKLSVLILSEVLLTLKEIHATLLSPERQVDKPSPVLPGVRVIGGVSKTAPRVVRPYAEGNKQAVEGGGVVSVSERKDSGGT